MNKSIFLAIFCLGGLFACKSTKPNNQEIANVIYNSSPTQPNGIWKFESKGTFSRKEDVEINMSHEAKTAVNLQKPMELKLELQVADKWRTVRRLYCPCLQDCPAPPQEQEIEPQERFTFRWKPEEQWCEDKPKSAAAPVGKYRLTIHYRTGNDKKLYFQHYEFYIKK